MFSAIIRILKSIINLILSQFEQKSLQLSALLIFLRQIYYQYQNLTLLSEYLFCSLWRVMASKVALPLGSYQSSSPWSLPSLEKPCIRAKWQPLSPRYYTLWGPSAPRGRWRDPKTHEHNIFQIIMKQCIFQCSERGWIVVYCPQSFPSMYTNLCFTIVHDICFSSIPTTHLTTYHHLEYW